MVSVATDPWFDAYLMVDWSSNARPKSGADSIWIAYAFWEDGRCLERKQQNLPTREQAMAYVDLVVRHCLSRGLPLMIGFDFPFSYPEGAVAAACGVLGHGPQWNGVWQCLHTHIVDSPDNANNRFDVANMLNKESGTRCFWGRPTMAELHVDLRGVFKKIRPDFDLAAPGLREAWERGDRDQFLVDTLEEPIRYTEGKSIGIKR
jgi:hypothetical protein